MFFKVRPDDGIPIYEQIARQVVFAVADGALRAGDLIPSVRELAKQLAINPNTVVRAYQHLQNEQIIETVRGTGLAITKSAVSRCSKERVRLVRQRISGVVGEARHGGLEKTEVSELFNDELKSAYARETRS